MTVVLLHPFPLDSRLWAAVRDGLGCGDVLSPDLAGFGTRPRLACEPDLDAVASDVWVQIGDVPEPVIVGISLGGYVALAMMRQRGLAGIGLVDTKVTADSVEAAEHRARLADQMEHRGSMGWYADQAIPTLLGKTTVSGRPEVVAQVREWIGQADPVSVAWMARAMATRPDSRTDLSAFEGPVLLVRGDEDTISTSADMAVMANAAPTATQVVLSGCGHLPPVEDAAATAAALGQWLESYV